MSSSNTAGGVFPDDKGEEVAAVSALVQAHGLALVVRAPLLRVVQLSSNATAMLQRPLDSLLLATLRELGGTLHSQVAALIQVRAQDTTPAALDGGSVASFSCTVAPVPGPARSLQGLLYRIDGDSWLIELEAAEPELRNMAVGPAGEHLLTQLGQAVQRVSEAADLPALQACLVQWAQRLSGCERAALYAAPAGRESDAKAHWTLLQQHAGSGPDTDWPAPARRQFDSSHGLPAWGQAPRADGTPAALLAQRDTRQSPAELVPALLHPRSAVKAGALDLSRGNLASLPPEQLQTLHALGVVACVRAGVLHEGRVWAWLLCEDRQPRHLPERTRAALALLVEAVSTRVAAIEHHARSRMAQQVRAFAQRLIEATSLEGDWREALVRDAGPLLQALDAQGALLFHGGEMFACGAVPANTQQHQLVRWVTEQNASSVLAGRWPPTQPGTRPDTAAAVQVLAVRLSADSSDWLVWLRGVGPDRPRAQHAPAHDWSTTDVAVAAAFGRAVADISVQVDAVRLLIAETQLGQLRHAMQGSRNAIVVACTFTPLCQANPAFYELVQMNPAQALTLDALMACFTEPELVHRVLGQVRAEQRSWSGQLCLRAAPTSNPATQAPSQPRPVAVRAEPVPARDGNLLGFILMIEDRSAQSEASLARERLEAALSRTERALRDAGHSELVGALLVNAGIAAMDISDDGLAETTATLLAEVQASTERAAALFKRISAA